MDSPRRRCSAAFLLTGLLALSGCSQDLSRPGGVGAAESGPFRLAAGSTEPRLLTGDRPHTYLLDLAAGDYLELAVWQEGVDATAALLDPQGRTLYQVDSPTADRGPERILVVAPAAGEYRLEVKAYEGAGNYRVEIETLGAATEEDRKRAAAAQAFEKAHGLWIGGRLPEAAEAFQAALDRWRDVGEAAWQAEACDRLGRIHAALRDGPRAVDYHRRAAELFDLAGDARRRALALHAWGDALQGAGETASSLGVFRRALDIWRRLDDRRAEAATLNSLAVTLRRLGEYQEAIDLYGQALEHRRRLGERGPQAKILHNLGYLHFRLGSDQRALDYLEEAHELGLRSATAGERASTLDLLGQLYARRGDTQGALDLLLEALELRRTAADRRGEGVTLANIALVRKKLEDYGRAFVLYRQALEIFDELGRRREAVKVLQNLGAIERALARPASALEFFGRALELHRELDDAAGEADTLVDMAAVERRRGRLAAARRAFEQAFEIYEDLRLNALGPDLRASYFALLQKHYGAYIDLLMELDAVEPGSGYAALGLEAGERARARSLLEILDARSGSVPSGADPELREREESLEREINAAERLRRSLQGMPESRRLDRRLRALAAELAEVRARRRLPGSPKEGLEPLTVAAIASDVLDRETSLLEYRLGKDRSFLWLLGPEGLRSFELPPGEEIDKAARDAYGLLVRSHRRESEPAARRALCRLSRMILPPAVSEPAGRRLLVVSDGALQYVPFAALFKDPPGAEDADCKTASPLVVEHEIVHLPSASVVEALRRRIARRGPGNGAIAVLADPVFAASDPRLDGSKTRAVLSRSELDRLPFTRREAESILALAGPGQNLLAAGFAAEKGVATAGKLAPYSLLHFATHAVPNAENPALSSLALSRFDSRGVPRDGLLRAYEIDGLQLKADLVVLSACRTALGREVRGEGLVGLVQAFLNAGAARTIVSLWSVDDRATAAVMERLYRHILTRGSRPAAALRETQVALWSEGRYRAPYYWAGFVFQGEWR